MHSLGWAAKRMGLGVQLCMSHTRRTSWRGWNTSHKLVRMTTKRWAATSGTLRSAVADVLGTALGAFPVAIG